jgi:cytoskeletal protein RodZ
MMFPTTAMGQFGDKFRKAREGKELSLDDVSNVTKISARMLQAIEEEHFDQLPGGVFNKGFIRAYAKHLGLDSEDAVTDYLACLRQAQIDSHAGWDPEKPSEVRTATKSVIAAPSKPAVNVKAPVEVPAKIQVPAKVQEELPDLQLPRAEHVRQARKEYLGRPSTGPSWKLIAVAVLIVVTASILWMRRNRAPRSVAANSTAPATVATPAPTSVPPASATTSVHPVSTASSASPITSANASPRPTTPAAQQPAATQVMAATQTTAVMQKTAATHATPSAPAPPTIDPNQVKVEKKGDVTIRSFGAAATAPTDKPAATLSLVVRATENSWISVTSDGQLVTQETLIAPAHPTFRFSRELVVRVGNAAGVTFLWNGQELPPQGAESEAKTFTFDSQGMHVAAAAQIPSQN